RTAEISLQQVGDESEELFPERLVKAHLAPEFLDVFGRSIRWKQECRGIAADKHHAEDDEHHRRDDDHRLAQPLDKISRHPVLRRRTAPSLRWRRNRRQWSAASPRPPPPLVADAGL